MASLNIIAVLINILHFCYSDRILSCDANKLGTCKSNEFCNQTSGVCDCMDGYTRFVDACEIHGNIEPPTTSHPTTTAVITLVTLALIIGGLALVVRRYNLIDYARRKINQYRGNDMIYEDVMIGQDDPPLSP